MTTFGGVIPILATPFRADDEALDLESWERLIEFMIELGVDGLTILGVLGESNRLTDQERQTLIRTAVALVRRRLRGLGVTRLPRRPQPGTLTNPAGLTDRQLEILRLVAAGLSNAEIAQRLVVSTRTVDHHVSAILAKLGVSTRREAAARAAELEA